MKLVLMTVHRKANRTERKKEQKSAMIGPNIVGAPQIILHSP